MLAIIFSLISFFTPAKSTQISDSTALSDSTKRPSRTRTVVADSTGRFLRINRIFIVGNRVTRDPIILRELTLKSGDFIYSSDLQSILEVDKKKLINTRLFNTVEISSSQPPRERIA